MNQTKKIFKKFLNVIIIVIVVMSIQHICYASSTDTQSTSLTSTKLVSGTEALADAVISWMTGIGITICGGYFVYYVYCLKTSDEGERRRNMQNIKTTLISMVLITCGIALIDAILGFYK